MKLSRQARLVLEHIRTEPHITSWQAEGVYRIRRLASRIDEIVAAGYDVLKAGAKDATGQRYIRYALSSTQKRYAAPINAPRTPRTHLTVSDVAGAMADAGICICLVRRVCDQLKETA